MIQKIRNLSFNVILVIWITLFCVIGVTTIFNKSITIKIKQICLFGCLALLRVICGISYKVRGKEYLIKNCIIASKHQSHLDPMILSYLIPDSIFILKQELKKLPIVGYGMQKVSMIFIDRANKGAAQLYEIIKKVKNYFIAGGSNVIIFPEGTRVPINYNSPPYLGGVALIARRAQVKIIPAAINSALYCTRSIFSLDKRPGEVILEFMPALEPNQENIMSKLKELIEEKSQELIDGKDFTC